MKTKKLEIKTFDSEFNSLETDPNTLSGSVFFTLKTYPDSVSGSI